MWRLIILHLLVCWLFWGNCPDIFGQEPDTLQAAELTSEGKAAYKGGKWEEARITLGKAADAWKESLGGETDSLLWIRYFDCKRFEAYTFYKQFRYEESDSAFSAYLPTLLEVWGPSHPEYSKSLYYAAWAVYRGYGPEAALPRYVDLLELRKKYLGPDDPSLAEPLQNIARCYDDMGEFVKALDYYEQTIPIYKATQNEDMLSINYNLIGWIHKEYDRLDTAVSYYLKSIELFRKLDPTDVGLTHCLHNLGLAYLDLSQFQLALDAFMETLPVYQEIDETSYGVSLINIAYAYSLMGDYQKSIEYNLAALPLFEQLKQDYYTASNMLTLGITYQDLGKSKEALFYLEKALVIFQELEDLKTGTTYSEMSRLYVSEGKLDHALTMAKAAYESEMELSPQLNPMHAEYLMMIGNVQKEQKAFAEALGNYDKALEVIRAFPESPKQQTIKLNKGIALAEYGKKEQALTAFQEVLIANLADYAETDPLSHPSFSLEVPDKMEHLLTLEAKGQTLRQTAKGRLPYLMAADTSYQLAVYLADHIRLSYRSETSKLLWQKRQRRLFANAYTLCLDLYEASQNPAYLDRALQLSERSKTRVLYEMVQARESRRFAELPPKLIEAEADLRTDLQRLQALVFSREQGSQSADSAGLADLKTQLFTRQQQHDSLLTALERSYPGYSQGKRTAIQPSLQMIQARLDPDEVMLNYFVMDSAISLFAYSRDSFEQANILDISGVEELIRSLRFALQQPDADRQELARVSHALYQRLLEPVASILHGKNLIISPDGLLATIPFEVLLSEPLSETGSLAEADYLIRRHQIAYTYSVSFWLEEQKVISTGREALAFAPSFNERKPLAAAESASTLMLATRDTIRGSLADLQGAAREVAEMGQYMSVRSLLEEQATEAAFKSMSGQFGILHLATHAIIDPQDPLNSRLLFSIGQDSTEDGDLYAWELYQLDLNAQMAVLSACNTGFGKVEQGEGVMSLGRAFSLAGVPSIVMSLWPAEDESTAELMGYFYANLADGMPKDAALQQAKVDFLNQADPLTQHPFYWAGFVVQGTVEPLALRTIPWLWMLVGGLLLALGGIIVWRRKRGVQAVEP